MKIVVLDGYTLNPGDLSWDGFKALGSLAVHERTPPDLIVERAGAAEAVLTNKTPLNRETLRKLTALQYIGVLATGYNAINVEAAHKRGIIVTHVPDYGTAAVAEMVFALLFELTRRVAMHAHTVRKGRWARNPDYSYWLQPLVQLEGLTFGIVGFGRIGRAVARRARAFDMNVLVHTPPVAGQDLEGARAVDLDTLLAQSDVVSLHCPLTPDTEGLVNAERLARMKPTAYLINTSRGGLVDEVALNDALCSRKIAGAGLDVLAEEPPDPRNPLYRAPCCVITPHQAWATRTARSKLMNIAVENLKAFVAGKPVNVV